MAADIVPCARVDPLLWTWLTIRSDDYRRESFDPTPRRMNLERVREHWQRGGNDMMLWLLVENGSPRGYAITELFETFRGKGCYIPEAYIEPGWRRHGVAMRGFRTFEAWAEARGCVFIQFATHRSPSAYKRLLRAEGWRQAQTVFLKELTPHG